MAEKNTYKKIRHKLEDALDEDRFDHTLGVAKTAQFLACINGADTEKAYLSGLLHDCAKNLSHSEKIEMCKKNSISINDIELSNPSLLHSKCGAIVACKKYNIEDEDILNAIRFHTTGRPAMSLLEKIVFVADYIEPGRCYRADLDKLRIMAMEDLDLAVKTISENTLSFLETGNASKAIDPMTAKTYKYYKELIDNR